MSSEEPLILSGARKAAILFSLLGEDAVAPIFRSLAEEDLQRVTEEVANLGQVPFEVSLEILREFQQLISAQEFNAVGGQEVASRLLIKALGESGAKNMLERLTRNGELNSSRVNALKKADPQQLARFLAGEHSQTRALVLNQLDSKQASAVLMKLDPEARADCVRRLANLGQFSPDVAAKVSAVLSRRLKPAGEQGAKRADSGYRNVADLMNRLDSTTTKEILESIEREEPKVAIGIRDLMFTFDDFIEVPEQELRTLVNAVDKKTLMIALKGASEELRSRFYRTMSSRAVDMLKEDSEVMGPVKGKDVARAHAEIVAIARKLESEGAMVLRSEGEDEYVL
jgi:flagellar motor switch protein FliG